MKRERYKITRRLAVPAVVLVLLGLLVGNLQALTDYARLYDYQPPAAVASLADQTTMTDKARKLFYVNHPVIADRSSFNSDCNNQDEQTIILGCYRSGDRGIFLFDVSDPRLTGVEQVTAAHEMLHAAYARLSLAERQKVDTELQNFYKTVTDQRIKDTMAAYQKTEPSDVVNEMHSVFATEMPTLTPELETYYKQYFTDRSKVATYAQTYENEFTSRKQQVDSYDAQLKAMKQQIDSDKAELTTEEKDISAKQRMLEAERSSGDYKTYNSGVPVYNAEVDSYNSLIKETQSLISQYNSLVAQRNAVAMEFKGLTQSINSQLSPIQQ